MSSGNDPGNKSERFQEWVRRDESRKVLIRSGIALVVFFLLLPKLMPLLGNLGGATTDEVEEAPVLVDAVVPMAGVAHDRIRTTGTVRANASVNLSSEVSGKVTRIYFQEGTVVRRGQLLVKINDSELQADLSRAEFSLELMREKEERQRQLLESGGASQEEYNATRNELNSIEAEVELIRAQIARTEIRAPFDGVLGLRYIDEGSFISPTTRIATLQDLDGIKLDFSISERYMSRVQPGTEINFRVQGIDSVLTGDVYAIEPQIDTQTRTAMIRAQSENPGGMLRPGAFASVDLIINTYEDALMVPTSALVPGYSGYAVFTVRNGRAVETPVETGTRTPDLVHLTSGIVAGDTVLTSGILQVASGSLIDIDAAEVLYPDRREDLPAPPGIPEPDSDVILDDVTLQGMDAEDDFTAPPIPDVETPSTRNGDAHAGPGDDAPGEPAEAPEAQAAPDING